MSTVTIENKANDPIEPICSSIFKLHLVKLWNPSREAIPLIRIETSQMAKTIVATLLVVSLIKEWCDFPKRDNSI